MWSHSSSLPLQSTIVIAFIPRASRLDRSRTMNCLLSSSDSSKNAGFILAKNSRTIGVSFVIGQWPCQCVCPGTELLTCETLEPPSSDGQWSGDWSDANTARAFGQVQQHRSQVRPRDEGHPNLPDIYSASGFFVSNRSGSTERRPGRIGACVGPRIGSPPKTQPWGSITAELCLEGR